MMSDIQTKFMDIECTKALIAKIAAMRQVLDDADKSLDSKIDTISEQVDDLSKILGADSIAIEEIESLFD